MKVTRALKDLVKAVQHAFSLSQTEPEGINATIERLKVLGRRHTQNFEAATERALKKDAVGGTEGPLANIVKAVIADLAREKQTAAEDLEKAKQEDARGNQAEVTA